MSGKNVYSSPDSKNNTKVLKEHNEMNHIKNIDSTNNDLEEMDTQEGWLFFCYIYIVQ